MQNKEFKRHIAYEVLTILGTLALLLFVCRLWPILLLVILGIFIAAMRLLFLSARKVENIPPLLPAARPEPTDQDNMSTLIMNQAIAEGLAYQSEHERKGPRKQDGSCICTHMNAKGWFAK